ncbi:MULTISPECIES: choice-of-anchor D domain-containing protein [Acidobacteriaceae]|uniref:choice-of-anchor D domain-containing protein n=1 Tax=Acidobacteriaceae TaxID=204434 RepID=UPI0020B13D02|nr:MULTISPECIES: choice-of-anchor D domain-containing protein [Acidobacteriaceae]MDW5265756.1 choice-of-anchor D domain-containing protein [Edaphobacter sp.]
MSAKLPNGTVDVPALRTRNFLGGRTLSQRVAAGQAMAAARRQQAAMITAQQESSQISGLNAIWQPIGPNQVASIAYGNVTGRVTAIAIDPDDSSGNTVYLGTTGGGVWKSTNAAGLAANVIFTPLTDTLPVFSANAGSSVIPSLSIGAISVQQGVVLAGTGDPNDATDSFYGSGLLRSNDGGSTWTLIQDSQDQTAGRHSFIGLGFAGFAWSTTSPGTVVAAISQAAEGTLVNATDTTNSVMGLYYSTDAGATWQMSVLMDGSQIVQRPLPNNPEQGGNAATSVVWNSIRQRFYAAVRYHGYYESTDGVTWTRLAQQPGSGLTTAACPTNPDSTGNPSCPIFRGALAVQPNSGDTFALTVDSNNLDQGLWQDVCGLSGTNCTSNDLTFAKRLPSTPLETVNASTVIPQADYNLALAAVPSGSDTVLYAGTIDLYRCSLTAGCNLRNTTNAIDGCAAPAMVAPAQHAIATLANSTLLYLGNDGGLWRSTDGVNQQATPCSADDATHFQNLNGGLGSLAEVTSFAEHPTDPNTLLVGLGANGTAGTSSAFMPWPQLATGEGGTVAIDQTDPQLWYISTGAGVSIHECSSGSACTVAEFAGTPTIGSAQTASDSSLIDAPWLLDPALPANILVGTCRVWRGPAASGASWSSANAVSPLLAGPQNASCGSTNPVLRSLAAAGPTDSAAAAQNAGSPVLYAGMAGRLDGGGTFGGHLFSTATAETDSSASVWNDLTLSPVTNDTTPFNPGGFDISSLAADSHDPTGKTLYATVMGFAGNGVNAAHLYRTVDAGAHWANISNNLPNAPANSVLVDPNDANTVYVALDTGVYVTTEIATCVNPINNCWSIYGTSLPNAPVFQLAAAPGLPTGDGRVGELRVATYGRGLWQIPLLTALNPAQPAITLDPISLTYNDQAVATASAPQTITVTNSGNAPLTVSSVTITGDFNETDNCAATTIAVGLTCTVQVRFLPSTPGSRTGLLTVYGNVSGGQATATLSGTGTPPATVVLNPISLIFGSTSINSTSAAQNITISNNGGTITTVQTPTVSGGGFSISNNTCTSALMPDTGCTVAITFTPTGSGVSSGTFTITDGVGTQVASLTGTGTTAATDALSTSTLAFAAQELTTASTPQQITLTNAGDVALTLISAQTTSTDFTVTNACGNSLNAHSTCAMDVAFQPQSLGHLAAQITIADQYRTQTVAVTGTGIAPPGVSLSPLFNLDFAATGVGQTSSPQTVTLTNNGGLPLNLDSTVLTGDFSIVPGSDTCGVTLAPDNACTLQIAFTPAVGGTRTGTLTITDSAPNSPQVLRLSGTGVDFALNPDGNTTVTVKSGDNAVFPLLFTSSTSLPVSFTCSGAPLNAVCNVNPSSVTGAATTTVSVTVLTGTTTASLLPSHSGAHSMVWLAALLPLGLLTLRRRRFFSLLVLCCLLLPLGCGAGRQLPSSGSTGTPPGQTPVTPAGTYPIVVSASSAGLSRTITLTLIVQ